MVNSIEPNSSACFSGAPRTASAGGLPAATASAGPGPTVASAAGPPALASLTGYPARVAGCLLGKMCGDVLGAAVEGWSSEDVLRAHPAGLTSFDEATERGVGCYTDDTQMAVALVRSLLQRGGRADDLHAAASYAAEYEGRRGYGGTAYKILSSIKAKGIDAASIATIGTKFIPGGSFGNGGAMRIAPLGLVYRHAPPGVLRSAVSAALRCTHVHPTAVDGAFVVALAARYLATRTAGPARGDLGPGGGGGGGGGGGSSGDGGGGGGGGGCCGVATPGGLLDHLLGHVGHLGTHEMAEKLGAVRAALGQAPGFKAADQPWPAYFASAGWAAERRLAAQVAAPFQIRADDAAAAALAALCWHWDCPEDAIVAAVHAGGDTDTVAAITGALAGSLHGVSWIPQRWWDKLENGRAGRDEVLQMALQLAQLDTRD